MREILQSTTAGMNLRGQMLSELSHRRTDTAWSHVYEETHRGREQNYGLPRGWKPGVLQPMGSQKVGRD